MSGWKVVRIYLAVCAIVALAVFGAEVRAATIAHWTFNTPSLTTAGGNITGAADTTGNHNATLGTGTGSGTGSPYTSNPIPVANSISGKFGQALTLTGMNNLAGGGGQFLTYPSLTEIMRANSAPGGPSYTVSYWINTTTTNANQFTVLGDWGNSATNPGRFTYGYGFQFGGTPSAAQMRGQARNNTTGTGNGTDIYARAVSTPTLNDGQWHMLTWSFDAGAGVLSSYFDGALVETFQSAAANFQMILSSSPVGTFGLKGDTGNFLNGTVSLDEVWVFNHRLGPEGVRNLFSNNLAIPEPASLLLVACGLLSLSVARRHR